jgi:predicted transcriptional regulator
MKARRSEIEVVADMLRLGCQGDGKTIIREGAKMRYHQLQKYLDLLVERGCLKRTGTDALHARYSITERGSLLLKSIDEVLEALDRKKEAESPLHRPSSEG